MTWTSQDSAQALAVAGAAWAFLDAESRGVHTEALAALQVFQTSWNSWSSWARGPDSPVEGGSVPVSLAPGTWDAATQTAIKVALIAMTGAGSAIAGAFPEGGATRAANTMPTAQPPSGGRGVWFVTAFALRFPESSTDSLTRALWSCAAAVRGHGLEAGANLSRRTFEIASGIPTQAPAAGSAAHGSNQNAASLIAAATARIHDLDVASEGGPLRADAQGFHVPGLAARPQTSFPWVPVIIGTGVLVLGASLAAFWAKGEMR